MDERAKARAERKSLLDAKKRAAEEEKLVSNCTCYFSLSGKISVLGYSCHEIFLSCF